MWIYETAERLFSSPDSLDVILFSGIILVAFEALNYLTLHTQRWTTSTTPTIPVRGKHLDDLSIKDHLFISLNKLATPPFTYLYLQFAWRSSTPHTHMTLWNTLLPIPLLFLVYDLVYTLLHGMLHVPAIYSMVHKHHHQQKAPSRANVDAVNVHPLEFFLGEYNHLLALYVVRTYFKIQVHCVAAIAFLAIGAMLTGWNHTRFDITWWFLYDSKVHDVHHRIPRSNYGQYTMIWDKVFGTFRPYDPMDRIQPEAQLDPKTGKSFNYVKSGIKKKES